MTSEPIDLLIDDARFILSQDADRTLLERASIAVKGNRIVAVGDSGELRRKYSAERVIDASERMVSPGFVNAHSHLESCFDKGLMDDCPLIAYVDRKYSFTWNTLTQENYYFAAAHTLLSCLKTGTTTIADCGTIPPLEDSVVRAVRDIGARGVLARMMMDIHETDIPGRLQENTRQCLDNTEDFIKQYHLSADGRIIAALDIQQVCNSSDELIAGIKDLAERHDLGIQTHAAVNFEVVELTRQRTGMRDIEYLHHLGILGPRIVLGHSAWVDVNEIYLMKETGAHVAHVPGSSLHGLYGSLNASSAIPEMVQAGVNVALGNDETNTGTCHDMVREMYLVVGVHAEARRTVVSPDTNLFQIPTGATSSIVLDMATINGAKALQLGDEIGSIEVGKKADLVLWDLTSYEWIPTTRLNLISNFVFNATGRSARTVIVDGTPVIDDYQLTTMDEGDILRTCQEFGEQIQPNAPWIKEPEEWKLRWVK
jgi:cytosine/adenosine deaminase-related metal-dependent hydrolase